MSSVELASKSRNGVPPWRRLLITADEIAEMLGVSRPTVTSWRRLGLITPVELPFGIRRTLDRRAEIEAVVESLPYSDDEAAG